MDNFDPAFAKRVESDARARRARRADWRRQDLEAEIAAERRNTERLRDPQTLQDAIEARLIHEGSYGDPGVATRAETRVKQLEAELAELQKENEG